jgi:hypothetical protein
MSNRRNALIAIVLTFALCVFSTVVVAHSDGLGHTEEHCTCQLCHIQHVAVPQPSAPVQVPLALHVVQRVLEQQRASVITSDFIVSVPPAPPA